MKRERIRRVVLTVLALHIIPGSTVLINLCFPENNMPLAIAYLIGWIANGYGMAGTVPLLEWCFEKIE